MFILVVLLFIAILAYAFYKWNFEYWKRRGVPGPTPTFLFGNIFESFILQRSPGEIYTDIYYNYPNQPFVGVYRGTTPCLLVRNPQLIKEVTVKSFHSFRDNDIHVDQELDPLLSQNPFFMKGDAWKATRSLLTPCFTSGKMKAVYPLIEDNSRQLVRFVDNQPDATNGIGLEAKELCTKFTLNNVASCAFGLEGQCFDNPNSEFEQLAHKFLTPSSWSSIKFFFTLLIPSLQKFIRIKLVSKEAEEQLLSMVSATLKYRKDNNIVRNDFMHFLSQLKEQSPDVTDVDITGHAASFFGDGSETSAIVMSFVLYHLANNREAQDNLRQEVDRYFDRNEGNMPYESLQEMIYLDAVINESLRIHPPVFNLFKTCTSPYTYIPNGRDGLKKSVTIEAGSSILLPLYALHHDSQFYEESEQFKPERFVGENKEKLIKYAYFPFGEGPRMCLGKYWTNFQRSH